MIQKITNEKKTAVVFGAGFVGSRLCLRLRAFGWDTAKTVKTKWELEKIPKDQKDLTYAVKVGDWASVRLFSKKIKMAIEDGKLGKIHTVIYTAGNYPKNGATKNKCSRSELPIEDLYDEIGTQIFGPDIVFSHFLPLVEDGGSFIFTSSIAHDNLVHNLVVPEQWEHTISDMRKDRHAMSRGVYIHHLASGPTDTHYYNDENRPKKILPVEAVIEKIISLIDAKWNVSERMNEPD